MEYNGARICFDGRSQTNQNNQQPGLYVTERKNPLTKQSGMETIKVRDKDRGRQHEQEHMPKKKIRTPQRQFDNLDDKLPSGLRHDMRTQPTSVPSSRPPRTIRFIMFELSR